jgi:hypothetical protein
MRRSPVEGLIGTWRHFTDDVDYRTVEGDIDDSAPIRDKDSLRA